MYGERRHRRGFMTVEAANADEAIAILESQKRYTVGRLDDSTDARQGCRGDSKIDCLGRDRCSEWLAGMSKRGPAHYRKRHDARRSHHQAWTPVPLATTPKALTSEANGAKAYPICFTIRSSRKFGGPELIARGLRVEELIAAELSVVQEVRGVRRKLSLSDAYAYSLASGRQWGLLSEDGELRALAEIEHIPLYGVLWVTDQLFDARIFDAALIVIGLETIAAHPRCRLPDAKIQVRLTRYRQGYV